MGILSGEPIVLFGPGSEWFWSMAQFVVVAVTVVGIYYQFRLQRASNAFEQLNRTVAEWGSEPMLRARLRATLAFDARELPPDAAAAVIGNYFEGLASLVRLRYVDAKVVYGYFDVTVPVWWVILRDGALQSRAEEGQPTLFVHFEWLASEFARMAVKDGFGALLDPGQLRVTVPASIASLEDRIRMAEESRMVPAARSAATEPSETPAPS